MSKIPVIIAARNEQKYIGETLATLDSSLVEPIVAINGTEDNTAKICRDFGVDVVELEEAGKLPAIQLAVKHLGQRALDPVILLDADTRPLLPKHWPSDITKNLDFQRPSATAGMIAFYDGKLIDDSAISLKRVLETTWTKFKNRHLFYGANMSIRLDNQSTADRFLDMPHIWPAEDRAIARMIELEGGRLHQSIALGAVALTSSRYIFSLSERLRIGSKRATKITKNQYRDRAASGSRPFRPNSKKGY